MRWRIHRYAGARFPVLVNHVAPDDGPPVWEQLHPGVTDSRWGCDESVAIWMVPWPGHAGGFLAGGRPQQYGELTAHAMDDLFDLYDAPQIAAHELLDVPHDSAVPYLLDFDSIDGRILLWRMPGLLDDYLEGIEECEHGWAQDD